MVPVRSDPLVDLRGSLSTGSAAHRPAEGAAAPLQPRVGAADIRWSGTRAVLLEGRHVDPERACPPGLDAGQPGRCAPRPEAERRGSAIGGVRLVLPAVNFLEDTLRAVHGPKRFFDPAAVNGNAAVPGCVEEVLAADRVDVAIENQP